MPLACNRGPEGKGNGSSSRTFHTSLESLHHANGCQDRHVLHIQSCKRVNGCMSKGIRETLDRLLSAELDRAAFLQAPLEHPLGAAASTDPLGLRFSHTRDLRSVN